MPSFDVVSRPAMNEVQNAVQQAQKELAQRYDFRGTETTLEQTPEGLVVRSSTEARLKAAADVLQERLVRRGVSLRFLDPGAVEPGAQGSFRQLLKLKQGIPVETARRVVALIKEQKLKVQAAIQADEVRVSGKSKDDLQKAIRTLRATDLGIEIQIANLRD